ncbi:AfsA-related hotdog domain-containing protein [Amycolatopsis stemonae]
MTPEPTRTQWENVVPDDPACPGERDPAAGVGRTHRDVVVVADRFGRFARGDRVLTMTGLLALIEAAGADEPCGEPVEWVVHAGQGVDETDCDLIEAATEKGRAPVRLADRDTFRQPRARAGIVHKDRPRNVLLSGVHSPADQLCRADLRIHRDNELILDHHTGEHVQGIVIVEAMRQICIAQFETAVRPGLGRLGYAGVWQRIDLSFQDFLFPLPATVESLIEESDLARETNLKFRAVTAVRQHGRTIATAVIEYAMIAQRRIDALERRKADQATRAYLG